MINPIRASLVTLLALATGSCSFGPEISDHAVDYNKSVEQAHNSQVLLNILRASDRRPMHFTAISQVRGSFRLSTTGNVSLNIPFGGDADNAFPLTPSINVSESSSPSFDVAVLNSQEFANGILSPIDLSTFKFFWDQGWPDQLLLYVLVHKFTPLNGEPFLNTPTYDRGCELARANATLTKGGEGSFCHFRDWVNEVTKPGGQKLQFGSKKNAIAFGPAVDFSDADNLDALVRIAESEKKLRIFDDPDNPGKQRVCKIVATPTFCLGECPTKSATDLAKECSKTESAKSAAERRDPFDKAPGTAAVVAADHVTTQGHIELRSVQGAIYYLGEVIRERKRDEVLLPKGLGIRVARRPNTDDEPERENGYPYGLFELTETNEDIPVDSLSVEYFEKKYIVSNSDNSINPKLQGNLSGTVLALINQLMALQKKSDELPTTTAVEAVGQ